MDCDVAVLGGGPAGYTAAIRAAQLGGRVVCIEQEPELGGTCLRVGCIPTKAWVQTAHALHDARETFAKLGVGVSEPQLDFGQAAALEGRRRQADDRRCRRPAEGERCRVAAGDGPVHELDDDRRRRCGGRHVQERHRGDGLLPDAAADPGPRLAALRRLHRAALADRGAAPARRARRRHHRLRVRVDLRALRQRGDHRRDAADADPAGGRRRGQGAAEGVQAPRHHRSPREAVHRGRGHRLGRSSCATATASRSRRT